MDDYCDNDEDIGYAMLVDKHINKFERRFDENERKLNQYKHIEKLINNTDNINNCKKQRISNDIVEQSEESKAQQKQQQTTSNEINRRHIDPSLYCVCTRYQLISDKPTHIYTCRWLTCGFETNHYISLEHHIIGEHIATRIYRHYSRSFMELNGYQYRCLRCDYNTPIVDNIVSHVNDNHKQYKCSVTMCGQSFASKDELSFHSSAQHYSRAYSKPNHANTCHKRWKCFLDACGKCFLTRDECVLHEKQHLCVFNLNDSEYLNGNERCSLNTIRRYYQKRKVIDGSDRSKVEYRYLCLWSECGYKTSKCGYETYNYNAIQEHIHNSHTCPLINDELVLEDAPENVINQLTSDQ